MEARLEEMKRRRSDMKHRPKEKLSRNQDLNSDKERFRAVRQRCWPDVKDYSVERMTCQNTSEKETLEQCKLELRLRSCAYTRNLAHRCCKANHRPRQHPLKRQSTNQHSLDRRYRALPTSTDTFPVVTRDLSSILKTVTEISDELSKEDEENQKSTRQRDALSERSNNAREVEREEELPKRQLGK